MTISLKVAAGRLLKWNQRALEDGVKPRRKVYIWNPSDSENCYACKVGLVMLGRYGRARAQLNERGGVVENLREEIAQYGPVVACPVSHCDTATFLPELGRGPLGSMIEHLFETHKRSVSWIDKWLAELAEEDNA